MKTLLEGSIEDFVPSFTAHIDKKGALVLGEKEDFLITADSGFSGGVALPLEIIKKAKMELVDYDTFKLATGEIVELPIFLGKAVIREKEFESWFIPGDSLLGLEFLSTVGTLLSFDLKKKLVKLQK